VAGRVGNAERRHLGLVLADLPGWGVDDFEDEPADDLGLLVVGECCPAGNGLTSTTRPTRLSIFWVAASVAVTSVAVTGSPTPSANRSGAGTPPARCR
jgi:hypothetical protein